MASGVFRGHLDLVQQSHVQGWAARGTSPVEVTVKVNDRPVGRVKPTIPRPDVEAAIGVIGVCGFDYHFESPITEGDVVSVCFPDATELTGSPSNAHAARLIELLHGIDRVKMSGLEFGPLDRPILGKDKALIKYVDHADRLALLKKYEGTGSAGTIDRKSVYEVDFVWPGGALAKCVPEGAQFDFALASHVVEHTPDMIGWLRSIADVLVVGGLLNLAIPDKERSFDHRRRVTSTSTFIANHINEATVPTAEQVIDHIAYVCEVGTSPPPHLANAMAVATAVKSSGEYVDVHCQVFTQDSWLHVMEDLAELDLIPFELVAFFPTRWGANEFIVSMRKSPGVSAAVRARSFRRWP